jgi:CRP/FNR family transcriptional regulator, cyclic AMP receptor protein
LLDEPLHLNIHICYNTAETRVRKPPAAMEGTMTRITDATHAGIWHSLVRDRRSQNYGRGSTIYSPSEAARFLFFVASGQVGLSLRSPEGRPLTLRLIEAGHVFGHAAVVSDATYDTFAEATAITHVVPIPGGEVAALVEQEPELGVALLADLARHKAAVSQRIDEVVFKSVPARLASLLLDMARHHDGPHAPQVPRHSHRQLAEQINAYRETVTKVLNQFRDARLLEIERHTIMLLNLRRLEELAQG